MKLNENQLEIQSKSLFLKDAFPKFFKELPFIDKFNATEMNKINYDLRFVTFKKIERMMEISQFYKDLYSVSLPNEHKLHEEKLKHMRWFVDRYKDTINYTDRIKFTFTLLDPECNYGDGVYEQYSQLNFQKILEDGRKIIKSIAGNFKILHQHNNRTMEKFEIYDAPNSDFVFRLCYYPNKKAWIEIESKE